MLRQLLALALSACISPVLAAPVFAQDPGKIELHTKAKKTPKYPIYFVSNRLVRHEGGNDDYTSDRSSELVYGEMRPDACPEAKLKSDDITTFKNKQAFLDELHRTGASKVAMFVHGYRKSFEGSMEFAQNIASEIDMPVICFAWPSKNKYSAYMVDECTAEWSSYQLASVLHDLDDQFGADNVSLISHSLGARVVSWSLRVLATRHQLDRPFAYNLMFSPDVDRDTFLADSPFLKESASRVKVYLDAHDTRIWLSKVLHGNARIGTMDRSKENELLSNLFQLDTSMPSHHIPYPILFAAFHPTADNLNTVRN